VTSGSEPNIQNLLQQLRQMQQSLASAQEQLKEARVQGVAGGGVVKATVSGTGRLESLEISPLILNPDNTEELAEMVVAAVRDAHAALSTLQESRLSPVAQALKNGFGGIAG
jgi:DNA-binding YbaB/EbfC family protein